MSAPNLKDMDMYSLLIDKFHVALSLVYSWGLTAYALFLLFQVFPSILFVKANNAESNERIRFQLLASADLSARLKKKQAKVLIPHIVQIMFFGLLLILGSTSIIVSRGSLNCSVIVSFMTSLVLLIDPIQVLNFPFC